MTSIRNHCRLVRVCSLILNGFALCAAAASAGLQTEENVMVEITFTSTQAYGNPFTEVEFDVVFTDPSGASRTVPGFWAGGSQWKVRYASPAVGPHAYRSRCTDPEDSGLNGVAGVVEVTPYSGSNPLFQHGFLRVAQDKRHFEHADGTPFFWLGDTWWKGLCKRMTWEGFQELAADRKAKGFNVALIVCGPYPDESMFESRWENEGGKPYATPDFSVVNPLYFDYADRRIRHLVDSGIVPAIVGGWGRPQAGGQSTIAAVGAAGYKRHWRNLVARFGALPAVWILGGEASDPQGPWVEVAQYLAQLDAGRHLLVYHPQGHPRSALSDTGMFDFDMTVVGHGSFATVKATLAQIASCRSMSPVRPVLNGEACYENHMQINFPDVQRYLFWGGILSGAAGHTYGAAGIWHASVEGDPGITPVYDTLPWCEGMRLPGAAQIGQGAKFLERYPWWKFAPHAEWAESDCVAAGIPGELRFIYQPSRGIYTWEGVTAKGLEANIPYRVTYYDPVRNKRYEKGRMLYANLTEPPFTGHAEPVFVSDAFDGSSGAVWKDEGSSSSRVDGQLVGNRGMVTVLDGVEEADLMASVDATSGAEAGLILRYQNVDNYIVALYSPSLKTIFIHDRRVGQWGSQLASVSVPEIGSDIHLCAAACGAYVALVVTDGQRTYFTPPVSVSNQQAGKTGVWFFQIGGRQVFDNFQLSRTRFDPGYAVEEGQTVVFSGDYKASDLPSPQDWLLILERKRAPAGESVVIADLRNDFRSAADLQTTTNFTAGTGLADTYVSGKWNYYCSDAENPSSGTLRPMVFGVAGNAGNRMYCCPWTADTMPTVADKQVWNNVPAPADGKILLHAGTSDGNRAAVIRWTAGELLAVAGLEIQGTVRRAFAMDSASRMSFGVYVNGERKYEQILYGADMEEHPFGLGDLNIACGQDVDFVLDRSDGTDTGDVAELSLTIRGVSAESADGTVVLLSLDH